MSEPFQITISGDAQAALKKLADPSQVLGALAHTMDQQNLFTVGLIQREHLSYPRTGPSVPDGLRLQSNRLRGSIRASKARFASGGIESSIGSNVSPLDPASALPATYGTCPAAASIAVC